MKYLLENALVFVFIFNADSSIVFLVRQLEKTKFLFFTVFNQGEAVHFLRLSNNQDSSSQPQSSDNLCGEGRQKSVNIACYSFLDLHFSPPPPPPYLQNVLLTKQAKKREEERERFSAPKESEGSEGREESFALVFQTHRVSSLTPLRLLSRLNRK